MSAFSVHVASMEAEVFSRLGALATWTGVADPVWVIVRTEDVEIDFGRETAVARSNRIRVRKSEVANPQAGQIAAFEGRTFKILGRPRLDRKGVWDCEAQEL